MYTPRRNVTTGATAIQSSNRLSMSHGGFSIEDWKRSHNMVLLRSGKGRLGGETQRWDGNKAEDSMPNSLQLSIPSRGMACSVQLVIHCIYIYIWYVLRIYIFYLHLLRLECMYLLAFHSGKSTKRCI